MRKYSESSIRSPVAWSKEATPLTLAVDSGSPLVSIALGAGTDVIAQDSFPGGRSSLSLLERIHSLLQSVDCPLHQIERMIAARGPGSFTGLRSGLATLLGLSQALDLPAAAVPTFLPLAAQATTTGRIVAAIDALRGEWFIQAFESRFGMPLSKAAILRTDQIQTMSPACIVAFGSQRIAREMAHEADLSVQEADPLATHLLAMPARHDLDWDPAVLTSPLYLRPPVATPHPRRS